MKLGALATGAATTTLVLGAVVSLAPGQGTENEQPARKFDHSAHAYLDTPVDIENCAQCHGKDPRGAFARPGANGHQPCLTSGCHAEDFLSVGRRTREDAPARYAKAAVVCLGCHENAQNLAPKPYAKAKADNLYQNNSKPGHYIEMNHLAHTKAASADGGGCRTCHVVDAASFELSTAGPGHGECSTCHDGTGTASSGTASSGTASSGTASSGTASSGTGEAPSFSMGACQECHNSGAPTAYYKERRFTSDVRSCNSGRHAALSAKRKAKTPCFAHEREGHRTTKSGEPVQCGHCHFMFASKRYEGHGYESLLDVKQAPLIDNSRERAHKRCGTSGCHKSQVDQSEGTGQCGLCHSSKAILGTLIGAEPTSKPKPRKRRNKSSLDDLVN